MSVFFITGIDTGCGKTFATGLMARWLKNHEVNVITQKLIQTGCTGISEDILEHRRLMDCGLFPEDKQGITCPYVFPYPASPHLAASLNHTDIDINILSDATDQLIQKYDVVLLEGAGGLHVPLTHNMLTIDYLKMKNYPVILVSSSKLGSINHTLLSIESCAAHGIDLCALLYNRLPDSDSIIADDSVKVIRKTLQVSRPQTKVTEISRDGNLDTLSNLFTRSQKLKSIQ